MTPAPTISTFIAHSTVHRRDIENRDKMTAAPRALRVCSTTGTPPRGWGGRDMEPEPPGVANGPGPIDGALGGLGASARHRTYGFPERVARAAMRRLGPSPRVPSSSVLRPDRVFVREGSQF